ISAEQIDAEIRRFTEGRAKASAQLNAIKETAEKNLGAEKAEIFEGHIMLLEDEELENEITDIIKSKKTADYAVHQVIEEQATALEGLDDEY
ncbi:phosphoenolpyruvate-utilizing N-terminal domain-containing protein, partial [Klebsiella pneumoniae]